MEGVDLAFEEEALREMARLAMKRKAGARGLRAVMESFMMEIMYEVPGQKDVKKITITADQVRASCSVE
jgi:ATP-dependent Clp protease ATP-binding subunit ClpX